MKFVCIIIFLFFGLLSGLKAQSNSVNISSIKPISRAEFNAVSAKANEGDIVLIKGEGMIYYYSGNQWYAMKGECYPKTSTPSIDSVVSKNEKVYIYFGAVSEQKYNIAIQQTSINLESSVSPVIIDQISEKRQYIIELRAFSKCGGSSPVFYNWENK
jgi:hypothetical protein